MLKPSRYRSCRLRKSPRPGCGQAHPILQTDGRSLVTEKPAAVPAGTRIVLDPVGPTQSRVAPLPLPLDPIAGRSWPALAAAFPALAESHFAMSEMMRLAIPQAGP